MEMVVTELAEQSRCHRCGKKFVRRQDYIRHMARKTPCGIVDGVVNKPFQCQYCRRGYVSKQMKNKHQSSCKFGTPEGQQLIINNAIVNSLRKEMDELRSVQEKQLAEQTERHEAKIKEHEKEIAELRQMLAERPQPTSIPVASQSNQTTVQRDQTIIQGNQTNITNNTTNTTNQLSLSIYTLPSMPPDDEIRDIAMEHGIDNMLIPIFKEIYCKTRFPENLVLYAIDVSRRKLLTQTQHGWHMVHPQKAMQKVREVIYQQVNAILSREDMKTGTMCFDDMVEQMVEEVRKKKDEIDDVEIQLMLDQLSVVRELVRETLIARGIINAHGQLVVQQ